jgi:branched-chain amino acid transport system substrate-binding protein
VNRRLQCIALAIAAAALVACAAPSAQPAQPAAKTGQAPLLVGAALSLTGSYERFGKNMKQAYELWTEHTNSKGGLLGRQVELRVYDDQSEPETGARLYEKLINEDKVDLLLGPYSTAVTLATTTVSEKYKFPVLAAGASGAQIWGRGYKYVFGFYSQAPTYSHGALEIARDKGYQTVALVNEDTAFPQDVVSGAEVKAKELGLSVVFKENYPQRTTDFSVLVQKLKAANPDVVVGGTYLPDSTGIIRQSKDASFTPKMFFFTTGPALPEFGTNLEQLAEGIVGNTEWESTVRGSGVEDFVKAYQTRWGEIPGYHAAGAYASGQVLAEVVKKAGSVDREKLRDSFATGEFETVFGPYKVDSEGRQVAKPNFIIQWQQGNRVVVWPKSFAGADVSVPFAWK